MATSQSSCHILRSQHDLVKRMKQSGDGIQTKQLTGVLGDMGNFHVKPYETLMEDEKKKLRAYWAIVSSKELPADFEARRERKLVAENLRTSLCLELAGEEAEQVAGRTAHQNGGITEEEEEEPVVDHSPEDVPQDEDEDEGDNDKSDTDTSTDSHDSTTDGDVNGTASDTTGTPTESHDSPNMSDRDAMDTSNTDVPTQSPQGSSDERDQGPENTSGNSSGRQDEGMEDTSCKDFNPGAEDDTSCKDTALEDHDIPDTQAQEPKAMDHTISPMNSPDMMPVQDCADTSYASFPVHSSSNGGGLDAQTDDLMCYPSSALSTGGHDSKTEEMDCMILDHRREPGSVTASTPSDNSSTLLLSKPPPLHSQNSVEEEEGTELNGPAKYQEVLCESVSPVDSSFNSHTPGSTLYAQRQLKRQLSGGGPAASMIDLGIDGRRRQQAQIAVTAPLPVCSPASLLPPFTNQLNGIRMVPSYSAGHMKQSVDLQHSMATNGHVAQSGLVLHSMTTNGLVQEQMQLLDESHNNGLYPQPVGNNMYSGSALGTFPMVEPQANFAGHATVGGSPSSSWFPNEQPSSHNNNNWSGLGSSGMVLGQDLLPSGDGSLSSVLSQYKQVSGSQQFVGRRNLVPPPQGAQAVALPSPAMYVYAQNNNAASSSQVDGGSLQWAQGSHGNGMAAHPPPFRQFGGDPWSR